MSAAPSLLLQPGLERSGGEVLKDGETNFGLGNHIKEKKSLDKILYLRCHCDFTFVLLMLKRCFPKEKLSLAFDLDLDSCLIKVSFPLKKDINYLLHVS